MIGEYFIKIVIGIYLISAECISTSNSIISGIQTTTGMGSNGQYGCSWTNPTYRAINQNTAELFMFTYDNYSGKTNVPPYYSIAVSSILLDTNLWNGFTGGISGAKSIGSPTLEMFAASWNENCSNRIFYTNAEWNGWEPGLSLTEIDCNGLGKTEIDGNLIDSKAFSSSERSIKDNLYFCSHSFFLSTPAGGCGSDMLFSINNSLGDVDDWGCCTGGYPFGIRPIIYLPNSIEGERINGIWHIIE